MRGGARDFGEMVRRMDVFEGENGSVGATKVKVGAGSSEGA